MINVAVFFGGESCEHDISIITGLQLISKINEYLYNVIPIYIQKNGEWITGNNLKDLDNFPDNLGKTKSVGVIAGLPTLFERRKSRMKKLVDVDVAILCLHGINGEDGSLASIMQLSKIPYSSCNLLSSAICMDKVLFNDVCIGLGVDRVPAVSVLKENFKNDNKSILEKINNLGLPVIIKPSRQGSSIGIKICKNIDSLYDDLNYCFDYDNRLLVEKYVDIKKEVNIACFFNKNDMLFSKTEEPIRNAEILDFNSKYTVSASGMERMKRISPANIEERMSDKIKEIAQFLYKELDMFGVVRFDFIIDKDNNLFINEVNSIPGSMANYLFGDDYPYTRLIEDLISNALIRKEREGEMKINYESNVLKQGFNGFKK